MRYMLDTNLCRGWRMRRDAQHKVKGGHLVVQTPKRSSPHACASLVAVVLLPWSLAACSPGTPPFPVFANVSADVSAEDSAALTSADSPGPVARPCFTQPHAQWHTLAPHHTFDFLAAQPGGVWIAAGPEGWLRLTAATGALLQQGWNPKGAEVTAVAVSGTGAFLLAGHLGSQWVDQISWVAVFSAEGEPLWTETGEKGSTWLAALGVADGFVLAGRKNWANGTHVVVERRKLDESLVWSNALAQHAFVPLTNLDLAETATGTVLLGGEREVTAGNDASTRPWLYAIKSSGQLDGGVALLEEQATLRRFGPLLPDGRRLLMLVREPEESFYETRLYAWKPGQTQDLGVQTNSNHGPGMSALFTRTSDFTLLPARLSWVDRSWYGGGAGQQSCQLAPGTFASVALAPGATPVVELLKAPSACTPVAAKCPTEVFPMRILPLPDGGFAIAGTVINCNVPGSGKDDAVGWVGRYLPLCGL